MNIDFDSYFRNRIESMLVCASWVGPVRKMLGLKAVSQVWNGNAQWYFWIHGAPGAYSLTFAGADGLEFNGRQLLEGRFVLKCYPFPGHPTFDNYSAEERALVKSDRFDSTQTPRFESAAGIPDSLFTVGAVSVVLDARGPFALMAFESLDAWKSWEEGRDPLGGLSASLVRSVPGWSSGFPLFDCLVGLYAHYVRQPPVFTAASRCHGFEYVAVGGHRTVCRSSETVRRYSLHIGFDRPEATSNGIEDVWHARLETGEEVLAKGNLPRDPAGFALPEPFAVNPNWWKVALSEFHSELTSTCGCGDHHNHNSVTLESP